MVDSELPEYDQAEVKRVIRVALACTQTSPTQRPSMSRAVAMLSGDVEVSVEISRPGYLEDWKFDDITSSLMSGFATKDTDSYYNSTASTSTMEDAGKFPIKSSGPMLSDGHIGEGR